MARERKITPSTRALEYCAERGWFADDVERFIRNHRRDWMGCIDIIAVQPHELGVLCIQVTTMDNMGARRRKICDPNYTPKPMKPRHREGIIAALRCGNRVEVWGWAKRGARGQEKEWTLKVDEIHLDDLLETSYGPSHEHEE